jgi:serine/threonine protein kinase
LKIRTIIHPGYDTLRPLIERLPARFEHEGESIYKARNELKLIRTGLLDMAVKSFRIPHFVNRIAYAFFRPSKAKRSYKNALKLREKGIPTPLPVAYLEERVHGLLSRSYYISSYATSPGLLRDLNHRPLDQVKDLAEAFALFTADLHNRHILHLDYSPGNILYEKKEERYIFSLVDINRMRFQGKINDKTAAFNLRKLWGNTEVILFIAGVYARKRGFDENKFEKMILQYRKKFWNKYIKKHSG